MAKRRSDKLTDNFFMNVSFLAKDTGLGITRIELGSNVASGYLANMVRHNSSPTLRVASSFAKFLGYSIDQLVMNPEDFRKEVHNHRVD